MILFTLVLLLGLSGCLSQAATIEVAPTETPLLGSESPAPLEGRAILTCSGICSDQAQCGQTEDGAREVVLLSSAEPKLDSHDMIFLSGAEVVILDQTTERIINANQDAETRGSLRFYQVDIPDLGRPGWVAGWCVQQP